MGKPSWRQRLDTLKDTSMAPDPFALMAVTGIMLSDQDDRLSAKSREQRRTEILQEFADLVALDNRGVLRNLLLYILEQKIKYLLAATTIEEFKEIRRPQRPSYQKGKLVNGHPYPIPEEELVGWMIATAKHPPGGPETKRMEEVMLLVSENHPDDPEISKWKDYIATF